MLINYFAGVTKARFESRSTIDGLRGGLKSLLGALALLACAGQCFGDALPASAPAKVKVVTKREGILTRVMVRNSETTDMTSTVEIKSVNMRSSVPLPFTLTVPAGETVEAFTLSPENPAEEWSYSYVNHYTVGRHSAQHDDSHLYALPFMPGATFKCTQGYNGSFSHHGPDSYAVDFKMNVGTAVHAAREGVVVSVKDDSSKGGASRKYEDDANIIVIQHPDGTMAHYCHLSARSAKVKVGQKVVAGDFLALSGNTGFTSGPHLHFAVFKARDGHGRETIPVRFRTAEANGVILAAGKTYRAAASAPLAKN
jgi:murein DD-endopeptidase MepM/ murein hydrolase activator NlpD